MRPPARALRPSPIPWPFLVALSVSVALLLISGAAPAAALVISVQGHDGRALQGAVVTVSALEGSGSSHRPAAIHVLMDQVNRAFVPDLLVIPVGSTVEFPNSDSVNHQIYSFSPAKRFQLPLYHGKPYPPTHFDQTGIVTLGCNIHDEMLAYLVVTDAPWYGRTDAAGSWSTDLPQGRYRVTIWHPRMRDDEQARELTIADSDRAQLSVRLAKPLQPAPLTDRPHSWDY